MTNLTLRLQTGLTFSLLCLFCLLSTYAAAQKAGLEVIRITGVDRSLPVSNMAVDNQGRKWAANSSGVFQVKANDFAVPRKIPAGEKSVLSFRGGNADVTWSDAAFQNLVKTPCSVTAAWYDDQSSTLWIGTDEAGLFQFKTGGGQMQLVERFNSANSKLKSNNITIIFQDNAKRLWVGTDKGLMYGAPGRWKADLVGYDVQRVREYGTDIYVLADGEISKATGGEKWSDINLDPKKIDDQIVDFDIDGNGKMWVLSGWLTRYDLLGETYDVFAGPELYTSQFGSHLSIDPENAVWVGTGDKGVFQVDKASAITLNAFVDQPVSCAGNGKDAVLMAKVTGGDGPYTYAWSGGLSGANPRNVAPGTYGITVTDSKGKSRSGEVQVPDARLRIKAIQRKPASGPGSNDGAAEVDMETNASGLTIRWDNGETMATATQLTPGPHNVTVTDPKGCSASATVTITEKAQPLTVRIAETNRIGCAGDKSASLAVKVGGGKGPYKYAWNNPAATGDLPGSLGAGTYQVTVTDAAGLTSTASISIGQPESVVATVSATAPAGAGQNNGKAVVQAKGGVPPYSVKWDNGELTAAASRLGAGQHDVTVTDSRGCWAMSTLTVSENILPLTVRLTQKNPITCAGAKTGAVLMEVNGGKTPYAYAWNNDPLKTAGVGAGTYSLTVTDATGATAAATVTLKDPEPIALTTTAIAAASTGNSDGQAQVEARNGTAPYSYKWDNGETTAVATKLAPGAHGITVTDAAGCAATGAVNVTENIVTLSVFLAEKRKIACAGGKTGRVVASVTGGKPPYKLTWSDLSFKNEVGVDVAAGSYAVTVTDAIGQTSQATINIRQPEPLTATAQATAPASTGNADGQGKIQPKGGTEPYSYRWDNGETTAAAAKLGPGQRSVTVTDANGCTATAQVAVSENILPLTVVLAEKSGIKCAGEKTGSFSAQVTGGKAPFKYAWNNPAVRGDAASGLAAGDYQLTVTDAAGTTTLAAISLKQPEALSLSAAVSSPASTGNADGKGLAQPKGGAGPYTFKWDNGETTAAAAKLGPGQRSVTVTDANGCTATAQVAVSENILPLTATVAEQTRINCAGEKAALNVAVSGGKGPYKYAWSNPALKGEAPASVSAGDYQLTVTDATGKTSTATVSVKQPEALTAAASVTASASTGNADGKALVHPKGGAGAYTYRWDNGETAAAAEKLGPGRRGVTVTDANGCTATASVEITENILPLAVSLSEKSKIRCAGEKAALDLQVRGGKPPYRFNWNSAGLQGEQAAGLDAGDYAVTVTDALGATQVASATVKAPEPLTVTLARNIGATTERSNDGKAALSVKGGTGKYSVAWDTKQSGLAVSKLALGRHSATVTDANGCSQTVDFETEKRVLPELTGALETGQTIRMRLLNFATDSSSLKPESLPMLDELYDFMMENGNAVIEIGGHTNNLAADAFADQLSTDRAKAVADYLFAKGIDPQRVIYKGYGKRYPLVPNTSPEGRRTNQRVEIKIVKIQ